MGNDVLFPPGPQVEASKLCGFSVFGGPPRPLNIYSVEEAAVLDTREGGPLWLDDQVSSASLRQESSREVEGHAGAFHVPPFGGHVSSPFSRSRYSQDSCLRLLALETVAQGRCLGGYRLQAQPTQPAAVASHWPTPQEEQERLLPRHPGMVNLSVEEVVGVWKCEMPPTEGGGAGDPQKREDLADLLRYQPVFPKSELFLVCPLLPLIRGGYR